MAHRADNRCLICGLDHYQGDGHEDDPTDLSNCVTRLSEELLALKKILANSYPELNRDIAEWES
jgi:hypothetical protein